MNASGVIIFYIVFGFFGLVILVALITMLILWNRRKLTFCNFLNDVGKWERKSYKEKDFGIADKHKLQTFVYDGATYNFNIAKVTHDKLNRPIAHFYKGNPNQLEFATNKNNKTILINAQELTAHDFLVLMTSKVLRDIFQDDEIMQMLWIIIICIGVGTLATIIFVVTHKPDCTLANTNQTINVIAQGVRQAISQKTVV